MVCRSISGLLSVIIDRFARHLPLDEWKLEPAQNITRKVTKLHVSARTHLAAWKLLLEGFGLVSFSENEVGSDFDVYSGILSGDQRFERTKVLGVSVESLQKRCAPKLLQATSGAPSAPCESGWDDWGPITPDDCKKLTPAAMMRFTTERNAGEERFLVLWQLRVLTGRHLSNDGRNAPRTWTTTENKYKLV